MRITLLMFLMITVLSKKIGDIYKKERQIQKETLNECILKSKELKEDMKEIYGDIQKAFINHHYLDILKKLLEYNPRNNKIIFQCHNTLLNEEDDIVLGYFNPSTSVFKGKNTGRTTTTSPTKNNEPVTTTLRNRP